MDFLARSENASNAYRGAKEFDFGKVKFTQAFHGSSFVTENNEIIYMGMPAGILLFIEDLTIYHAGDTALFSDMKLIGERHPIDIAFYRLVIISRWAQRMRLVQFHF